MMSVWGQWGLQCLLRGCRVRTLHSHFSVLLFQGVGLGVEGAEQGGRVGHHTDPRALLEPAGSTDPQGKQQSGWFSRMFLLALLLCLGGSATFLAQVVRAGLYRRPRGMFLEVSRKSQLGREPLVTQCLLFLSWNPSPCLRKRTLGPGPGGQISSWKF